MESTSGHHRSITIFNSGEENKPKRRRYSIFEIKSSLSRLTELLSTPKLTTNAAAPPETSVEESPAAEEEEESDFSERWGCNTCELSFECLNDQRSHFKSDFHRFNIKLSIAGKDTIKEDEFDEWTSDSLVKDYDDISSISGSEDEQDKDLGTHNDLNTGALGITKQKFFIRLTNGEMISFWKCLLLGDNEKILYENDLSGSMKDDDTPYVTVREVTEKLLNVIHEPRDNTCLRVILLVSGGHFAGCVFDGNNLVAQKTFHRYVVRAKAGQKQSSQDAGGKIAHSAGASIRRHNELALKKEIRELLAAWKPYFEASTCILFHAPSHNRQLLFDGENPYFSCPKNVIRHIPLTVRRPTLKEVQRLYKILTQISLEPDEEIVPVVKEDLESTIAKENNPRNNLESGNISEDSFVNKLETGHKSSPLHEAARAGNAEKVLELLEQGFDPCVIDERGRTPYRLAAEKEVRNTFRRFMALNPDKWDWQTAKVPSPLTKEMEESQNAKQANKDAKRKARAKELKVLRKAREKKVQESHRISSTVAGVLVFAIGSLIVVAFSQMSRGRWWLLEMVVGVLYEDTNHVFELFCMQNAINWKKYKNEMNKERKAAAMERRLVAIVYRKKSHTSRLRRNPCY